jgi:hypothetical protein
LRSQPIVLVRSVAFLATCLSRPRSSVPRSFESFVHPP